MANNVNDRARNPQDLERLLVSRQHAGDIDGMTALYEPTAILDCVDGRLREGATAIHSFFEELVAAGKNLSAAYSARRSSSETWRSHRRACLTAASPRKSLGDSATEQGSGRSTNFPSSDAPNEACTTVRKRS